MSQQPQYWQCPQCTAYVSWEMTNCPRCGTQSPILSAQKSLAPWLIFGGIVLMILFGWYIYSGILSRLKPPRFSSVEQAAGKPPLSLSTDSSAPRSVSASKPPSPTPSAMTKAMTVRQRMAWAEDFEVNSHRRRYAIGMVEVKGGGTILDFRAGLYGDGNPLNDIKSALTDALGYQWADELKRMGFKRITVRIEIYEVGRTYSYYHDLVGTWKQR